MSKLILEMQEITKTFPGVKALKSVNFSLQKGEVHALMGENGAGKSTLMKILSGVYDFDEGKIILEGEEIVPENPSHADSLGISIVHQELNLIPHASIYENITIGREKKRGIFLNKDINRSRAIDVLENKMGLKDIDVNQPLFSQSAAIQQMVSIARAILDDSKVLILDEPTSSLDKSEVKGLFEVIRKLKEKGMAVVYISHKMEEIFEICDRITVLRDGNHVNTYACSTVDKYKLICDMIGKDAQEILSYKKSYRELSDEAVCEMNNVSTNRYGNKITDIDLKINKGEVLGLSGLLGSGRTEIANTIYGIDSISKGKIKLFGNEHKKLNPEKVVELGIGLVPEERRKSAIIPNMSIRENITLPFLKKISRFGFIDSKKEKEIAESYLKKLEIKAPSIEQPIKNLSGGNQQKVILSRWLAKESDFLILDEPTRGIDVGSKREIEKLILKMSEEGKSILMISSEMEELVRNCDRVNVIVDGYNVSEVKGEEITESNLISRIASRNKRRED